MTGDGLPPPASAAAASAWRDAMVAGMRLTKAGSAEDAVACFERARGLKPDSLPILLSLAAAHYRAGDPAAALAAFGSALALEPASLPALHGRALSRLAMRDRDGALTALRAAVRLNPHAWKSWASIADITPDEAERRQAIEETANALVVLSAGTDADPALRRRGAHALIDARRYGEAAHFLRTQIPSYEREPDALSLLARAAYRAGDFEAAFRLKQAAWRALDPGALPLEKAEPFRPDAAVEALGELCDILGAAGLKPFLAAGTLLGFVRNDGPLAHDRDVDIGIIRQADGTPDLAAVLRTHPDLMLARNARPGDRYFALMHKGVGIDLFLHDACGDGLLCGVSDRPGDVQWRFTKFGLAEATFGERRWTIPDDPRRYLAESYGPGWETPDTGFASAISSPALYKVSRYARAYYALARAERSLRLGDRDKAAALLAQSPIAAGVSLPHESQPEEKESAE